MFAAMLGVVLWACDGDESTPTTSNPGGAGGGTTTGVGGAGGSSGLACNEYCGPVVGCSTGVTTQECLTQCEAAPELNTDQCRAAYRARNLCVGELDCDGYDQYLHTTGTGRPCATQEAAIVAACAS